MDEHTFNKLAEIPRPILERNEYYTSEKREKYRERKRERIEESRRILRLALFVFVNPCLLGFLIVSCGAAVQLESPEKIPFRSPHHIVSK